jgi:hypothetical protein
MGNPRYYVFALRLQLPRIHIGSGRAGAGRTRPGRADVREASPAGACAARDRKVSRTARRQDSVRCLGLQLDRFFPTKMRERSLPEINPTLGSHNSYDGGRNHYRVRRGA